MNHHTAAQKGEGGGWHYVSLNHRTGGYPLGYCREHEPHDTEDEARRCYRLWQRAHVRLDVRLSSWADCHVKGCKAPTKQGARIDDGDYHLAPLCPEHLTHEHALVALGLDDPIAGDAWQS